MASTEKWGGLILVADTWLLFGIFVVLLLILLALRMWIGLALLLVGFVGLIVFNGLEVASRDVALIMKNSLFTLPITAIPVFVFMGMIVAYGGVGPALFSGLAPLMERLLPGGLLHANLVASAFFGAVSGSSLGGAAAIGTIAIEEEKKRGYDAPFVAASIAAGGTQALMIPPSLGFIIFGAITGVGIDRLFIAGILPGIFLMVLMMIAAAICLKIWPHLAPPKPLGGKGILSYVGPLLRILPVAALAVGILYAIWGGVTTPTEVGSVGVLGAILLSIGYRQLTWKKLGEALRETVSISVMLLFLFLGAIVYSTALSKVGLISLIQDTLLGLPFEPSVIVIIIFLIYFVLGMFVDAMSINVITTPVIFPIFMALDYHPLWVGVMMMTIFNIASITPPVGLTLYVAQSISGEDLLVIAKWAVPFVLALTVGAMALLLLPQIATWLPGLM
jgi:tripartite ATP-independent transporter DctM subunit